MSGGAFNVLVTSVGVDSEAARLPVVVLKVAARGVGEPSNCASDCVASGSVEEWTRGEDVVRYPMCEG